jgi:hypothetical protein
MSIKQQKVIITISHAGGEEMTINLKFTPGLAGKNSPQYQKYSAIDKNLQYTASKIGGYVMQALKRDNDND